MNSKNFTIVIPTRERAGVLSAALRTAISIDYDNLEIIVSDNYSSDGTRDVVNQFKDPRVKYINTGKRVSMSHNWEFALNHVTNGWVTFLGDDDGILPGAIERVWEIAEETGVQAIRSATCRYRWPELVEKPYGRLRVSLRGGFVVRDSKNWLAKVMSGVQPYTSLPMLYNGGFVDTALIKKVRSVNGVFYRSMIPDVYSAVVFAKITQRFAYSHEPLAINGSSKYSGGSSAFRRNGLSSQNTPASQFWQEPNIPFHEDLPLLLDGSYPLSLEAIVYESYLQSLPIGRDSNSDIMYASQLQVILTNVRKQHSKKILEWGRLFAAKHGLDFDLILRKALWRRKLVEGRKLVNRVVDAPRTVVLGSPSLPLRDVYEATIAAAAVKSIRVSRFRNLVSRAREHFFRT